jgi:hypothetical protein
MKTYFGGKQNQMGAKEKYSDLYYVSLAASDKPVNQLEYRKDDKKSYLFG